MKLLKRVEGRLTFENNRTQIRHEVELRRDFRMVEIRFRYEPWRAEEKEISPAQRPAVFPKWSLGEDPDWRAEAPGETEYRNVLMISVDDSGGIRGMTHMHRAEQVHRIGVGGLTTEGFRPGMVPKGPLRVTISAFSVWGKGCSYTLEVYGEPIEGLEWRPFELHSHTVHSDGSQTVRELEGQALALGYGGLALTDHNTVSGQREWSCAAPELVRIGGMEWTTFHGHLLFLNCSDYLDWRGLTLKNFTETLRRIRERHPEMIVGIAHPFSTGSIGCAGCGFEFELRDWTLIDYLEVWSQTYKGNQKVNEAAYRLWTRLLDEGRRITAVAGGDWHVPLVGESGLSATYLCAPEGERSPRAYLAGLRAGRAAVSMGPVPLLELHDPAAGADYGIGGRMPGGPTKVQARVGVREGSIFGAHRTPQAGDFLVLESSRGALWRGECPDGTASVPLDISGVRWVRLALYDKSGGLFAFTNAIYREAEEPGDAT